MVDQVNYLKASKQHEKSDKGNLLETIFENSYRDLRDAGRRLDLYRNQLSLAEISLQILEVEYATNSRDFEEILRMERLVLKYALEIEKARADNEAAISFINYLMGK